MKKLYVPKGETRHYQSVEAENIIVKGCLKVDRALKARHIFGSGIIEADTISADTVTASDIEAGIVIAESVTAKRVFASEIHAKSIAVSQYLETQLIKTDKLITSDSQIGELIVGEVIHLTSKPCGLLRLLLASFMRSAWVSLTDRSHRKKTGEQEQSEETIENPDEALSSQEEEAAESGAKFSENADDELKRLIEMYSLAKKNGLTYSIVLKQPEYLPDVFDLPDNQVA